MPLTDSIKDIFSSGKSKGKIRKATSKSNKMLLFYSIGIVLSILLMVGLFTYETTQARYGKAYSTITNEQQVVSQQIATYALEASIGNSAAFVQLKRYQARFVSTLNRLRAGDSDQDLPPIPSVLEVDLGNIELAWEEYNQGIVTILGARESIETVSEYVTLINESIPELLVISDEVVKLLVNSKAARTDIATAARQLALIQGVQNSLNQILGGGDVVMAAADQFGRETALIERILIAMLEGNPELGINKFTGDEVVGQLLQLADLFSVVKKNVNQILENSPQLFAVRDAASDIQAVSPRILSASRDLENSISIYDGRLQIFNLSAYAAGLFAVLLLILLGVQLVKSSARQLAESQDQNDKNQRAILRLLDEMTNLADGDLSTHTTVTEDITGAIADSVNYSIDALRDLVSTINNTADQVTGAVSKTQGTTRELAEASSQQAREISSASSSVSEISESMSKVSKNASDSADVARNSVNIAHKGGETVRKTISGMESIREQIQETSKRIKRLGESSQEIGDIVNLITEISDQTNILALNAAIQASMAGEAGRGFAVVADEVQRLAERTGDATKQIAALVKTIQTDTNEAISSMEQSTSNVVEGANLAEDAGSALDKIETVSTNLAQRILQISNATQKHAKDSVDITETMNEIQKITLKTSEGSAEASDSIGELSNMVKALHRSVAGFKLPGVEEFTESTIIHDVEDLTDIDQNYKQA
jgi:twitching motility protein PilJ